jgi:sec-independent protein translocase protein TatA
MQSLFGFTFGTQEMLILLVLGVLLFGRRLPEVGRYLGKGIVEFKKGLKGLEDEVDSGGVVTRHQAEAPPAPALDQPRPPQRVSTSVPKFEDNANSMQPPPQNP